jgi:hypothetical protein
MELVTDFSSFYNHKFELCTHSRTSLVGLVLGISLGFPRVALFYSLAG